MGLGNIDESIKPNYEVLTPLCREMKICSIIGIDHSEFIKKPFDDKMKWLFYEEMERERESHFAKKEKIEMDKMRNKATNKNRVR